jgi:hypothetical protein
MASTLTNHWVCGGLGHHGYAGNNSVGYLNVLAWNHSVIKGRKQFLPRERVASTGWKITKAAQKNSSNVISITRKNQVLYNSALFLKIFELLRNTISTKIIQLELELGGGGGILSRLINE